MANEDQDEGQSRDVLMEKLKGLKQKNEVLKKEMQQYEKCDPARLQEMKVDTKICKDACDRWVDNIFILQDFIKK